MPQSITTTDVRTGKTLPPLTSSSMPEYSATTCVPACTDTVGAPSGSTTAVYGSSGYITMAPPIQEVHQYRLVSDDAPRNVFMDGVSQGWRTFQDFAGNVVGFAGPILLLALFVASVYFAWFPRPRRKK
jgi:hypothetical protein